MDLKRRTLSAKRGHKLLKDKQDGLIQAFLAVIRNAKKLRIRVEEELQITFRNFLIAAAWMPPGYLQNALSSPQASVELTVLTKSVMGVKIPMFTLKREGSIRTYGYPTTNALLDDAVTALENVFDLLVELAQIEKQAENMAIELQTTRRRVNALQYKMIPDMRDTVKFITMKLDEAERSAIVSVMRIKSALEKAVH